MLGVMLRKLVSKKWMFACLLLGCVLMTATVISFPLYQNATFDRMLRDEFTEELVRTGHWPARFRGAVISEKSTGDAALHGLEEWLDGMEASLHVETKEKVLFYRLNTFQLTSLMDRNDFRDGLKLRLAFMSGLPEHVELVGGEMYSESGVAGDGAIEVVMTQDCMVACNLLLGETLRFNTLQDPEGRQLRVRIVGIIDTITDDYYWEIGTGELKNAILMDEKLFREYFVDRGTQNYTITCCYSYLFDYNKLISEDADTMRAALDGEPDRYRDNCFRGILDRFLSRRERISVTLFILQVPVLVLLAAFLFMISGQMYELEKNEISVIKSRGSSGGQIFRLYIYQSVFLAVMGVLFGVPLGGFFSKILGSASNFLEFGLARQLELRLADEVYIYLAAAAAATVLIMALPAVRHSRVSIVHLKQGRTVKKKAWWEKFFLDLICLGVALYGYYSYSRGEEQLLKNVLLGKSLDPLLYLCSSLFIVGMGLLYLRLQPLVVKLIYLAGRRFWRPASYASFMENLKNGRRQQFIMLFLILTIALGIFHATVARTILQNVQDNTEYLDGVDIILKEAWKKYEVDDEGGPENGKVKFSEIDLGKYSAADFIGSYTRVIAAGPAYSNDTAQAFLGSGRDRQSINLLGIHTREFGEKTWVDSGLLEKPYYAYLNELAEASNGILMSENCRTFLGIDIGHMVTITYQNVNGATYNFQGRVLDFVDYWPGFAPTATTVTEGEDYVITEQNYLAVVNIGALQRLFEDNVEPYELWISLRDGADPEEAGRWINENNIKVARYKNMAEDLQANVENPLFQGTNGVLTMGFMVMILLCGVGYLIYWIMSIRSREMMFGVLRAFGMHKGELFHMLMLEQLFSGVLTVFAGIGIGRLVSRLYVPMLQTAYAVSEQVLPMKLSSNPSDLMRLYNALAGMMIVCLAVLIILVVKLNVARALKLGEE